MVQLIFVVSVVTNNSNSKLLLVRFVFFRKSNSYNNTLLTIKSIFSANHGWGKSKIGIIQHTIFLYLA